MFSLTNSKTMMILRNPYEYAEGGRGSPRSTHTPTVGGNLKIGRHPEARDLSEDTVRHPQREPGDDHPCTLPSIPASRDPARASASSSSMRRAAEPHVMIHQIHTKRQILTACPHDTRHLLTTLQRVCNFPII